MKLVVLKNDTVVVADVVVKVKFVHMMPVDIVQVCAVTRHQQQEFAVVISVVQKVRHVQITVNPYVVQKVVKVVQLVAQKGKKH